MVILGSISLNPYANKVLLREVHKIVIDFLHDSIAAAPNDKIIIILLICVT